MWLEDWDQLKRVLVIGLPIYLAVIGLLRVLGTRALSKMNAFDLVASFALGSLLAAAILTPELPGGLALASVLLLLFVQFALSWLAVRVPLIARLTTAAPVLVLWRGQVRDDVLRGVRLSRDAVQAAVRTKGEARLEDIYAVILETDGSLSVIARAPDLRPTALEGVKGMDTVKG